MWYYIYPCKLKKLYEVQRSMPHDLMSMSWGWGLLCCCLATSLYKMRHWFLIVGLISKSLKYSYTQLLIWFMPPLSAPILPDPLLPHYPSSRPGGLSFFPKTLSVPFYSELSQMCPLPGYPLLTSSFIPTPFSPADDHSSFRASWNSTLLPLKSSLRSPQQIFLLLHRERYCSIQKEVK